MQYLITASTDKGDTKQTNQDAYLARQIHTTNGDYVFAILCDGMGGLSNGEIASATVVNAFNRWADEALSSGDAERTAEHILRRDWTALVTQCNETLKAYGREHGISLGTTLTAMLMTAHRYAIVHVGDTRAYEIRESLRQITTDQTFVQREVERGNLTPEQARTDSRQNVLLQCIGASETVIPELYFGDTLTDSVYLLCSDGFRHQITEEEIRTSLAPYVSDSADTMKRNLDVLIERDRRSGELDNITAIAIRTYGGAVTSGTAKEMTVML